MDFHIKELGDDCLEKIGISNPSTDCGQNRSSRSSRSSRSFRSSKYLSWES